MEGKQLSQMLQKEYKSGLGLKVMFGSMYYIQGALLTLPLTMILVYEELPPQWLISLFVASKFPFSLKFLSAPLVEKYTHLAYGRRKTWIILTQLAAALTVFVASFLTHPSHQLPIALLFIISIFFISLQDIAVGAAAIKQLRNPAVPALLQGTMQGCGYITTSIIFLEGVSEKFAQGMGLSSPLMTGQIFLSVLSSIIVGITVVIHFFYKEQTMEAEKQVGRKSLWSIIKYYRYFFQWKTKYCRSFCMFLIYMQGFLLYEAYYEYELIQNQGVSRDTINTITNVALIPIIGLSFIFTPRVRKMGWLKTILACLASRWVILFFILIFFPTSTPALAAIYFLLRLIETFRFILSLIYVNAIPRMSLSAIFITMLESGVNFGRLDAFHVLLAGLWGWKTCAIIGLALEAILITFLPKMFSFAQKGTTTVEGIMEPTDEKANEPIELKEQQSTPQSDKKYFPYVDEQI